MQYESKVVKITYIKIGAMRVKRKSEEELEEVINKLGLIGWQLVSTVLYNNVEMLLFFSRPKKSLEEMV